MRRFQLLRAHGAIWVLAFGYFAFYIPYSALTKALSKGWLPGSVGPVPGLLILPATVIATSGMLLAFLVLSGRRGESRTPARSSAWPSPRSAGRRSAPASRRPSSSPRRP